MTSIEMAKAQVAYVKEQILEKYKLGDAKALVIADYTKEEYEKFLP